ncbi:MAG TPA: PIG-L family deacetylase [Dissulfurispiraceae bacterium]
MITGFPDCRSVLVLAPHPDDEALGCAGTLALLNRKGVSSTVVFLTDGERLNGPPSPEMAAQRRAEGVAASAMLGCGEPNFLGLPDGGIGGRMDEACTRLSEIIAIEKPDFIFAPSPVDHHEDHLATAGIALRLMEDMKSFRLAFCEIYSTVRFTHLVDISELVGIKEETIMKYRVSLYGRPELYVHATLGLNAHRSLFTQTKGYYEAFWIIEKPLKNEEIAAWVGYRA